MGQGYDFGYRIASNPPAVLDDLVRTFGLERRASVDPAPGDRDGVNSGRPGGADVVGRVSDVDRVFRPSTEPLEREQNAVRVRLPALELVAAHDRAEEVAGRELIEREVDRLLALRGDDAEAAALPVQPPDDVLHPREEREPGVERNVVRTVDGHELVHPRRLDRLHLLPQGRASDTGQQPFVGHVVSEDRPRGMPERGEDHRPRVDEGAVEVEEDDREAHRFMLER